MELAGDEELIKAEDILKVAQDILKAAQDVNLKV